MWTWSLPFFDRPCRTAIHRQSATSSSFSANPIPRTKSLAMACHSASESSPSEACSDSEQCHTFAST